MDTPRKRPTEAWIESGLGERGLGHVVVARFKVNREVEIGVFLVDVYCLGVKNAFFTRLHEIEYEDELLARFFPDGSREAVSPACARSLIEGAVAYAQALGFPPNPDYHMACRVLGGIHATDCDRTFPFGKDAKPFYIQGPNESPAQVMRILDQLRARCGEGHFDYLIVGG